MSFVIGTYVGIGGRGNLSGAIMSANGEWSTVQRLWMPAGASVIQRPTSAAKYTNRHYLVGGYTANLLIDEQYRVSRQGMRAPDKPPTVSVGAGATAQDAYLRFYDEITGERSPLSAATVLNGDLTRTWTALPTSVPGEQVVIEGTATIALGVVTGSAAANFDSLRPGDRIAKSTDLTRWARIRSITGQGSMTIDDTLMALTPAAALTARVVPRASHVELWVSVEGSLPRFIVRVRLGVTAVTEATPTLALGEAEIESFTAMPVGAINLIYNQRQAIAGVDGHEDTIYLSKIGYPERNTGLALRTPFGEPVVGMFRHLDYVVVLCPESSYRMQGLSDDDYILTVLDPDAGGIGHGTNIHVNGGAYVIGRNGPQFFNGAFHPVIPTRRREWSRRYAADPRTYEEGCTAINPNDETVQFYPTHLVPASTDPVFVGMYAGVGPTDSGAVSAPEWTNDSYTAGDGNITFARYMTTGGQRIGKMYRGNSVGIIYVEDTQDVAVFTGTAKIVLAHNLYSDPGGSRREGKMLERIWSYVLSEDSAWTVLVWPGDEYACPTPALYDPDLTAIGFVDEAPNTLQSVPALWKDDVAAAQKVDGPIHLTSESEFGDGNIYYLYAPKTVHVHPEVRKSGRGHTLEYQFTNPIRVRFMGVGGRYIPGDISRGRILLLFVPTPA